MLAEGKIMEYNRFGIGVFGGSSFTTHSITAVGELHTHDFFELSYVIRGSVKHSTENHVEYLTNDCFIILRPDDAHAFDERDNKTAFHRDILVSRQLFKECCDFLSPTLYDTILNAPSYLVVQFSQDDFKAIEDSLKFFTTVDKTDEECVRYVGKAIVCNLLLLYYKSLSIKESPNKKLIDNILDTMKTPNVLQYGIPALVKEVNYSHGHLCRLIKQSLNRKLLDILIEMRMEQAAIMLKTTNTALVDIAASVGYESLSHFISVFEKFYSISPYKYRKRFKDESSQTEQ